MNLRDKVLDMKKHQCTGPDDNFEPPAEITVELREVSGYYAVYPVCPHRNSDMDTSCEGKKQCIFFGYNEGSLKRRFFPKTNIDQLEPLC